MEISQDLELDPEQESVFMEKCNENRKHKAGIIFGKSIVNVCIKEEGKFSIIYFGWKLTFILLENDEWKEFDFSPTNKTCTCSDIHKELEEDEAEFDKLVTSNETMRSGKERSRFGVSSFRIFDRYYPYCIIF